jgi:hypothetical protein
MQRPEHRNVRGQGRCNINLALALNIFLRERTGNHVDFRDTQVAAKVNSRQLKQFQEDQGITSHRQHRDKSNEAVMTSIFNRLQINVVEDSHGHQGVSSFDATRTCTEMVAHTTLQYTPAELKQHISLMFRRQKQQLTMQEIDGRRVFRLVPPPARQGEVERRG